jgi:uncharacterized NAD(P)/FAD-binding protein YdhS
VSNDGKRVAIVGGGFSGAMLAARLAERGVASSLIERTGTFGPGLAYATPFDGNVLNVRAGRMGAVDGQADGFVRWLEANHPVHADPGGFAPRRLYGLYVQDRLAAAEAAYPGRIGRVAGEATVIDGTMVRLADGRTIEARAVVLATGNPVPRTAGSGARIIGNPWAPGVLEQIGAQEDVVLIGAGLTMVDMVLWLVALGWTGRATALSRHGLTPRAHGPDHDAPLPPTAALTSGTPSRRLAEARRLARDGDWRGVMEGLRPITGDLWARADTATRARWLRHLRPWWDVHRHRIAAPVAAALAALEAGGRLRIVAGRVRRIETTAAGVTVDWSPRQGGEQPPLGGGWLIDCSGPAHDTAADPLFEPLIAAGRARLDPLKLGLDLDQDGRVLDADGRPDPRLFVLGPPARAAFWETIAVPDIRKRIELMADRLSGLQISASR